MNNDLYTSQSVNLGSLTRATTTWYSERSVVNTLNENIVLIDRNDNHTVVPSSVTNGAFSDCIVVLAREVVGASVNSQGTDLSLPGSQIKITKHALRNGPIYVETIDALLCTEEQALTAEHPFKQINHGEALEQYLSDLADRLDVAPGIKLVANDPTGSYDALYTLLDTDVVCVPVSHDMDDNFTLSMIIIKDAQIYRHIFDLSDLLKGVENTVYFAEHVIPWVTTSKIAAEQLAKTFKWISPEQYHEFEARLIQDNKTAMDQIKNSYEARLLDANTSITTLKATNTDLIRERDEYKQRYMTFKTDEQLRVDRLQAQGAIVKSQNDVYMSDNNLAQSNYKTMNAEKESNFKMAGLVAAAALPVVGVLAIELFKSAAKR